MKAFHGHQHWKASPPSTDAPIWICLREGPRDAAEAEPSAQACEKCLRSDKATEGILASVSLHPTGGLARDVSDSAFCIFDKISCEILESSHSRPEGKAAESSPVRGSQLQPSSGCSGSGSRGWGRCCQGARSQGSQRGCQDRDTGSDRIQMSMCDLDVAMFNFSANQQIESFLWITACALISFSSLVMLSHA